MVELVEALLAVVQLFWDFAVGILVPDTAADLTILHVAMWTIPVFGFIGGAISVVKRMIAGRGRG